MKAINIKLTSPKSSKSDFSIRFVSDSSVSSTLSKRKESDSEKKAFSIGTSECKYWNY